MIEPGDLVRGTVETGTVLWRDLSSGIPITRLQIADVGLVLAITTLNGDEPGEQGESVLALVLARNTYGWCYTKFLAKHQ